MTADPSRRHRLAHLIVARRTAQFGRRALHFRLAAVAVLVLACSPSHARWWPALLIPAVAALTLDLRGAPSGASRGPLRATLWVTAALLLVAVPAWVATDLPFLLRCVAVGSADVVVVSVASAMFLHPRWFDPSVRTRPALEQLRRLSGPTTAAVTAALVIPATWPAGTGVAVWVCALVPSVVGARVYGVDHSVRSVLPLIREEGQQGRDQVLREIHGALSTELRQLEQYARDYRQLAPEIYERAVSANSSLRETLTLADEERDTSTTTDTLVAAVLTLTRAEGASVTMRVDVEVLEPADRDLVRLVLNELVCSALEAGASAFDIVVAEASDPGRRGSEVACGRRRLRVSVTGSVLDDPGAGPLWSPHLERKLAAADGSLTAGRPSGGATTVHATWGSPA